jgi:hypothetical protein
MIGSRPSRLLALLLYLTGCAGEEHVDEAALCFVSANEALVVRRLIVTGLDPTEPPVGRQRRALDGNDDAARRARSEKSAPGRVDTLGAPFPRVKGTTRT